MHDKSLQAPNSSRFANSIAPNAKFSALANQHIRLYLREVTMKLSKVTLHRIIRLFITINILVVQLYLLFDVHTMQTDSWMVEQRQQSCRQFAQSTDLEDVANFQIGAQLDNGCFARTCLKAERPFHVEGDWNDSRLRWLFFHPLSKCWTNWLEFPDHTSRTRDIIII